MKNLLLIRDDWNDERTLGTLLLPNQRDLLDTIERPWIPTHPGGKPRESCIPAGLYDLVRHTRPNGDRVLALMNEGLGVYHYADDRTAAVGRYLILIHAGNWVTDVVGCIAPGLSRGLSSRGDMVNSSRIAMHAIMNYVGDQPARLEIRQHWI